MQYRRKKICPSAYFCAKKILYDINVDLGKSNVDSQCNVELRYTHVSAVKFTPEPVKQKLLPTENYSPKQGGFQDTILPYFLK